MNIQNNFSLKNYNTFGIEAKANQFVSVSSIEELKDVLTQSDDIFILGGGSNMLLTQNIEKLVVHVNLKGREIVEQNDDFAIVKAQAGENWHEFVLWCIAQNLGGIENLSLIPGNVGTTPIQNIGAYGVEIKDTMFFQYFIPSHQIEWNRKQAIATFKVKDGAFFDPQFGSRTSIEEELTKMFN